MSKDLNKVQLTGRLGKDPETRYTPQGSAITKLAVASNRRWRTAEGDDRARGADGTKRYLPDAAWELLSDEEKRATDTRKRGSDEQHVANTDAAKEARKAAELVDVKATEARARVGRMHGDSQLDRAEQAERELGKGRKTVLRAIEEQRTHD